MVVTAKLRYLRIAPRKVRLVADLIRGKSVEEAQTILSFTVKKAVGPLLKLLNSAIANAKNNFRLDPLNLFISKIEVGEGPKHKRWMPRARGQASEIQKKTSHITMVLDEIKRIPPKVKKVKKARPELVEGVEKIEKVEGVKKLPKPERPKPKPTVEIPKPKAEKKGIKRIFRRKAF